MPPQWCERARTLPCFDPSLRASLLVVVSIKARGPTPYARAHAAGGMAVRDGWGLAAQRPLDGPKITPGHRALL